MYIYVMKAAHDVGGYFEPMGTPPDIICPSKEKQSVCGVTKDCTTLNLSLSLCATLGVSLVIK